MYPWYYQINLMYSEAKIRGALIRTDTVFAYGMSKYRITKKGPSSDVGLTDHWRIQGGRPLPNRIQFFHFPIRFCRKVPTWEVGAPPPTGNPGSATADEICFFGGGRGASLLYTVDLLIETVILCIFLAQVDIYFIPLSLLKEKAFLF